MWNMVTKQEKMKSEILDIKQSQKNVIDQDKNQFFPQHFSINLYSFQKTIFIKLVVNLSIL